MRTEATVTAEMKARLVEAGQQGRRLKMPEQVVAARETKVAPPMPGGAGCLPPPYVAATKASNVHTNKMDLD